MKFTDIFNKESAKSYMVERELHGISNHLSTAAYDIAVLLEKIDRVLQDPASRKELTQDQEIDLGVCRERMAATLQDMIVTSKKF
jgi:hypothetical protein